MFIEFFICLSLLDFVFKINPGSDSVFVYGASYSVIKETVLDVCVYDRRLLSGVFLRSPTFLETHDILYAAH